MFNKLILLLACFFVSLIKFTLRTYPYLNETINITRTYPDLTNRQITSLKHSGLPTKSPYHVNSRSCISLQNVFNKSTKVCPFS